MEEYCVQYFKNLTLADNWSVHNELYPFDHTIWKDIDVADSLKIFAYAIVIVGGLLGNVSVILTVSLNRSMRTTINYYVANLAVSDAMICIICMLPHALNVVTGDLYVLGEFMCKFNPFTQRRKAIAENMPFPPPSRRIRDCSYVVVEIFTEIIRKADECKASVVARRRKKVASEFWPAEGQDFATNSFPACHCD